MTLGGAAVALYRSPGSPQDLRELERRLASIRFRPRASLGQELEGFVRRQARPDSGLRHSLSRMAELAVLAAVLCFAIYLLWATALGGVQGR